MQPVICLMGPTAVGKTALAVQLVQHFPFEIISVDSAMVYSGMDIGTAKPDDKILKIAPHRLINIRDPHDSYSAAQFCHDAEKEIQAIFAQGKIPLLVGGTMLYFRALQEGLSDLPSANPTLRAEIVARAEQLGWPALHEQLSRIDPVAAKRIHPHDSQRIQRALEVYQATGQNLTSWQGLRDTRLAQCCFINLALAPTDRAVLHERIAVRFKQMLHNGLIEEVRQLMQRGDLTLDTPAIRSVGYRQVWEYLQGKWTFRELTERGTIATRQLAKRQLTWLRSWPELTWFDSEAVDLYQQVENYLKSKLVK